MPIGTQLECDLGREFPSGATAEVFNELKEELTLGVGAFAQLDDLFDAIRIGTGEYVLTDSDDPDGPGAPFAERLAFIRTEGELHLVATVGCAGDGDDANQRLAACGLLLKAVATATGLNARMVKVTFERHLVSKGWQPASNAPVVARLSPWLVGRGMRTIREMTWGDLELGPQRRSPDGAHYEDEPYHWTRDAAHVG
jgi:hypothetical protein